MMAEAAIDGVSRVLEELKSFESELRPLSSRAREIRNEVLRGRE